MIWTTTKNDVECKTPIVHVSVYPPELLNQLATRPGLVSLGIDPGKNFGLAIASYDGYIETMNGILNDKEYTLKEVAFWFIKDFLEKCGSAVRVVVVEGASYGDRFGQVKLAEVRAGFALGCSESGLPVTTVAPKTPRKVVFGDGNKGAWDVWMGLNHNASDALCLALYPFYLDLHK